MGTRAQVKIIMGDMCPPVYLYRHWDGDCLIDTVFASIKSDRGRSRADDPEYLARIIFEDMITPYLGDETGYGIGTAMHGDIAYLITVDPKHEVVTWEHLDTDFIDQFTFEEIGSGVQSPNAEPAEGCMADWDSTLPALQVGMFKV